MVQTRMQKQIESNQQLASLISYSGFHIEDVHRMFQDKDYLQKFPHTIRRMYEIVGDLYQTVALNNSQWHMLSLQHVVDMHENYKKENPECQSVDFAYIYHGMGHYVACSVDKHTGRLYYRLDGGSDGHGVALNRRFALKHSPTEGQLFLPDKWLKDVRDNRDACALNYVMFSID